MDTYQDLTFLEIRIDDGIAVVTLAGGRPGNAVPFEGHAELSQILPRLGRDERVDAIGLRGAPNGAPGGLVDLNDVTGGAENPACSSYTPRRCSTTSRPPANRSTTASTGTREDTSSPQPSLPGTSARLDSSRTPATPTPHAPSSHVTPALPGAAFDFDRRGRDAAVPQLHGRTRPRAADQANPRETGSAGV